MILKELLNPQSLALIGASKQPGKVGYEILANLINGNFKGKIIPVNPTAKEILGIKCYPTLRDFPDPLDLSVIAVPTPAVKEAVEISIRNGVRAIIVITAGFKEVNPEGAKLEKEIAALCKLHGVRLLGPNCLGLINTHHHLNASFSKKMPPTGTISVLSQSGALCTAILDWAVGRRIGLAKLVSIGNKADLCENDFLQAFAADEETKVITGYLESVEDGNVFMKIAEEVSQIKPVVIMKVGTTQAGGKAASSHTGSLAGKDIAYGAAFKRSGVIRAENFESLVDYSIALSMQPLPKGDRVAIITNAGGPGIMAADAVEKAGMRVTTLAQNTATALRSKLPTAASVGNPIDVLGDADPERYTLALNAAQDDDTVDAVVVILTPQAMTKPTETARAIAKCVRGVKPIIATFMGGEDVLPGREELTLANLPDYPSPERAVAVLKAMWEYASWKNRPPRVVTRFPVNRRRVERILSRQYRSGQTQIGEIKAKEILSAYGFNVPEGYLAGNLEQAIDVAQKIGYPVAMKISSPEIIHKSDFGGVKLGLANRDMVMDAYDLMMVRAGRNAPQARIDGVYIEKMASKGKEIIIGMTRDPQFGPMMMFGLGGIFVEVMKDVSFYIAPITADEAMQMLQGTKSYAMLKGARGQSGVDLNAIAVGLQRISQLSTDFPQIMELDINPFIVGEIGSEPIVADARITLAGTK